MVDENKELDPAQAPQSGEKMLSQSEVNSLIGRAKAEAQEKARRQAEEEFNRRLADLEAQKQAAEGRGESTQEIDADKLYQQVQERFTSEMQQRQMEQQMQQVAQSYQDKMANGGKDYEDFNEVVKDFNPVEFPQIVYLVSGMDNAADIIYELSKNPTKLSTVDYLSHRSPQRAQAELQRIGQSIAANKAAQQSESQAQVSPPLDRMQPSSRTGSNGQMSVTDLRNQPWLRG